MIPGRPAAETTTGRDDARVRIGLAGQVVELRAGAALIEAARRRFGPFLASGRPDFVVVQRRAPGPGRSASGPEHARNAVELRLATGTAWIEPDAEPSSLDGVLRLVLPTLVAPGLVVHAALLGDGRRHWLCCGRSGAGKTTLAALAQELALCDELSAVHAGEDGGTAQSLPFWNARPGGGRLSGVYLLEHGEEHGRSRLAPTEAVRELIAHVCWPTAAGERRLGAFATLTSLAERVPVWRLRFRPDAGVLPILTGEP